MQRIAGVTIDLRNFFRIWKQAYLFLETIVDLDKVPKRRVGVWKQKKFIFVTHGFGNEKAR